MLAFLLPWLTRALLSDPGDNVDFSDLLFNNEQFANAMYNSLNEEGIFIAQTGIASTLEDSSSMNGRDKHGFLFKTRIREAGFKTIKEYEDVSIFKARYICILFAVSQ